MHLSGNDIEVLGMLRCVMLCAHAAVPHQLSSLSTQLVGKSRVTGTILYKHGIYATLANMVFTYISIIVDD